MASTKPRLASAIAPEDRARALLDRVTVGFVTALPKEFAAAKAMLEDPVEHSAGGDGAGRDYVLGEIPARGGGAHAVALVSTGMGNNLASVRVTQMLEHFRQIRSVVMVGIAGGVPHPERPAEHVRLGDVVVVDRRGVVQYDLDKETARGRTPRPSPRAPGAWLLEGVDALEVLAYERKVPWVKLIDRGRRLVGAKRPPDAEDVLHDPADPSKVCPHPADPQRKKGQPRVFQGPIGSGNTLLKNPRRRDQLRDDLGIKAVEMEGSGLADAAWQHDVGYLVVRGICDYCDEHKGDAWQMYAAIVAAAYARAVLERMRASRPSAEGPSPVAAREGRSRDRHERRDRDRPADEERGDGLLDHVLRVCRMREEARGKRVTVAWREAHPPFSEVAEIVTAEPLGHALMGPALTFAVGAVAGPVTPALIELFRTEVHARYQRRSAGTFSQLVYDGPPAPDALVREAHRKGVWLASIAEYQGLIHFGPYVERLVHRLERDPIYPPRLYVPQRASLTAAGGARQEVEHALEAIDDLLASPAARFVLVLGDFGTGKTFLLHELARRLGARDGPPYPVLIEMRSLEKAHSLDALVANHLALAGMERFDLPSFRYMLAEGLIALLFDGFDELALRVRYGRAADHFDALIQAAQGKAKVVLTSRTQHFYSDDQIRTKLGEQAERILGHRIVTLATFSPVQIRHFLVNLLGSTEAAEARVRLLDDVKDLLRLSENPRLLSFISEIPERELLGARDRTGKITAAGLYQSLLDRWFRGEDERVHLKGAASTLATEDRWKAVTTLALRLWSRMEPSIHVDELPAEVAKAIIDLSTRQIELDEAVHAVGSGTLLVRDPQGNFSFLHASVLEWLVARAAAAELRQGGEATVLGWREMSELMLEFFTALADRDASVAWARQVLGGVSGEVAKRNAIGVMKLLNVEAEERVNLAGQDLRGQDLSRRNLRNADLTGADLREAILVEADLGGAKLAGAALVRADLSGARLAGADLEGADASSARLLGADLRGARLASARLRHAQLVGARLDDGALAGLDTFGSAPPGASHADVMTTAVPSPCMAVAVSPDGQLIASVHRNGSVWLWDVATGVARRALTAHASWVRSVAFSPDGTLLASGSSDTTIRLWDVATGKELRVLRGHVAAVRSLAFSPDGTLLASTGNDSTVRLWEVAAAAEPRVLTGHTGIVRSIAFRPDGAVLASASDDRTIRLWDVARAAELRALRDHATIARSVAFSPDGASLAAGAHDSTVWLWDVITAADPRVLMGHEASVTSVAFDASGGILASTSNDNTIRLWDVATGAQRDVLRGHTAAVRSVAFSPDGTTLVSGSTDSGVFLWDVATSARRRILRGNAPPIRSVAFSPDGTSLAAASEEGAIRLWDAGTVAARGVLEGHVDHVRSIAFSSDGASLASASADGTVCLWDVKTRAGQRIMKDYPLSASTIAFSPDGASLAWGGKDSTVRLWDVARGAQHRVLKGHSSPVRCIAFSPDGASLASGADDGTVFLWSAAAGSVRLVLRCRAALVRSTAFSPDSASLATGVSNGAVHLWDVASGAERLVLKGHASAVSSVAFSPEGAFVASGAEDSTVRLWDALTGAERRVLRAHASAVQGVAFSPDGAWLASASDDGTVRIWDVAAGVCRAVLVSRAEGWAAFTPDGRRYKLSGAVAGSFWYAIGLCRFEPGELDAYLPAVERVPDDEALILTPRLVAPGRRETPDGRGAEETVRR
ncbi:phosphorylase family protein [Sorangium sp. So ce1153]|uniref:phosphorylase family protein n=1 Tax=Sorangium sp. So ce1153 TaxID=3133333 RepID=UPI003F60031C